MSCPVYRPTYKFHRVVEAVCDVFTDGTNPSLQGFNFSLSQLPDYTEFTNLFDLYRINKIEVEWNPEYTTLSDASPLSTALNVRFNSAIDLSNSLAPSTVGEVLQYQQLQSTGITKVHKRAWRPTVMMGDLTPCYCWIRTSDPNESHFGIKIAIEPSGTAMEFQSRVRMELEFANVN